MRRSKQQKQCRTQTQTNLWPSSCILPVIFHVALRSVAWPLWASILMFNAGANNWLIVSLGRLGKMLRTIFRPYKMLSEFWFYVTAWLIRLPRILWYKYLSFWALMNPFSTGETIIFIWDIHLILILQELKRKRRAPAFGIFFNLHISRKCMWPIWYF